MRAVALKDYRDLVTGAMVKAGQAVEVDESRFKALNATKYGQLVAEAPAESEKPRRGRPKKTQ